MKVVCFCIYNSICYGWLTQFCSLIPEKLDNLLIVLWRGKVTCFYANFVQKKKSYKINLVTL